uniref:Uncharacterized protein n=1 Tax=Arundo donax TaxID=35708 RepID=A0A0A9CDU9_ARUDO
MDHILGFSVSSLIFMSCYSPCAATTTRASLLVRRGFILSHFCVLVTLLFLMHPPPLPLCWQSRLYVCSLISVSLLITHRLLIPPPSPSLPLIPFYYC